jgi:peptide/nickel transport system substrate-binding protein
MKKLVVCTLLVAVFLMSSISTKLSKANDGSSIQLTPRDEFVWTVPYVEKLKNLEAFTFETTQYLRIVNRGEFIVWMIRSMKIELTDFINPFQDVSPSNPYYPYIITALVNGIIPTAEKFYPNQPLQRYTMGIWLINAKGGDAENKAETYAEEPCILAQDGYDEIKAISKEACGKLTLCYQPEHQLMSFRHIDSFRMVCPLEPAILGEASYGLIRLINPPQKTDSITISSNESASDLTGWGPMESIIYTMVTTHTSGALRDNQYGNFPMYGKRVPTVRNGLVKYEVIDDKPILHITHEIRNALKWSNGDPLTADDILFGTDFNMHPYLSTQVGGSMDSYLLNAEVHDENLVTITMKAYDNAYDANVPYIPSLPRKLIEEKFGYHLEPFDLRDTNYYNVETGEKSEKCLADEEFIKKVVESEFYKKLIHSGPYFIKEWKSDKQAILQANPYFLAGKPLIETINIKMKNAYPNELEPFLKENDTDLYLDTLPLDLVKDNYQLCQDAGYKMELVDYPNQIWDHIEFNVDNEILKDARVRKVLQYAIDRSELSKKLTNNLYPIAQAFFDKDHYSYQYATPFVYHNNIEKANELMIQAGWTKNSENMWGKDNEVFSLTFMTTSQNPYRENLQKEITRMWNDFGITVKIKNYSSTKFYDTILKQRQFEGPTAFLIAFYMSDYTDLTDQLKTTSIPTEENDFEGTNYSGYSNPFVDKLFEENASTFDIRKAQKNIAKIAKIVSYDAPFVPLLFRTDFIAKNKNLQNIFPITDYDTIAWNCAYWYMEGKVEEKN